MAEALDDNGSLESTTVGIYRTAATVKGGRRFSFSALVVVEGTTYNFFVQYKEDDGSTSQYRLGLKATNYYNDSNPSGVWFVLTQQTE
ncbi:MAG: hypothetical protein GWP75_00940 [Planctomycetia bacterium]|nr:hypothetical protein [Planctomycetia bacterium]